MVWTNFPNCCHSWPYFVHCSLSLSLSLAFARHWSYQRKDIDTDTIPLQIGYQLLTTCLRAATVVFRKQLVRPSLHCSPFWLPFFQVNWAQDYWKRPPIKPFERSLRQNESPYALQYCMRTWFPCLMPCGGEGWLPNRPAVTASKFTNVAVPRWQTKRLHLSISRGQTRKRSLVRNNHVLLQEWKKKLSGIPPPSTSVADPASTPSCATGSVVMPIWLYT